MRIGYFLIWTFLLGNVIGCQGVAQNKNQTNQDVVAVKSVPLKLKLNNEEMGTTADTSVLTNKLEEIFKAREENGVFRANTNEVEKTVWLEGDRSVSAEEIAKLFGVLNDLGTSPILIQTKVREGFSRPNPLTLLVYVGSDESRQTVVSSVEDPIPPRRANDPIPPRRADNGGQKKSPPAKQPKVGSGNSRREIIENLAERGIEIGFMGELFENRLSVPSDKGEIAVVANKNATYAMEGKQISASNLKLEIGNRLKTKEKDRKIIFVQAENFGNIEDIAHIALSAGAVKLYVITKSIEHKENEISFSLSPAYIKDKGGDEMPMTYQGEDLKLISLKYRGNSTSFEITVADKLFDKEKAESEIKTAFEDSKESFKEAEVSLTEIDGSSGVLKIQNDEERYSASWFGSRKKNGKYQLVWIYFWPLKEQSNYSHYEFLQIMKSIKFN